MTNPPAGFSREQFARCEKRLRWQFERYTRIEAVTHDESAIILAALRLAASAPETGGDEKAQEQLASERDNATDALSQMYCQITGRWPEWSNHFGYMEALEETDDALTMLRAPLPSPPPSGDLRERVRRIIRGDHQTYGEDPVDVLVRLAQSHGEAIAREATERAAQWRPIETAPKDGQIVERREGS